MGVGKLHKPKLRRGKNHEIFGQPVQIDERCRSDAEGFNRQVRLPHGVAGMPDQPVKAQQGGQPFAILR